MTNREQKEKQLDGLDIDNAANGKSCLDDRMRHQEVKKEAEEDVAIQGNRDVGHVLDRQVRSVGSLCAAHGRDYEDDGVQKQAASDGPSFPEDKEKPRG